MITIFISIILSLVLYGCETSYLIMREEYMLRVLRQIFALKMENLTVDWRRLPIEELYD
jgi:hypothetical protein